MCPSAYEDWLLIEITLSVVGTLALLTPINERTLLQNVLGFEAIHAKPILL